MICFVETENNDGNDYDGVTDQSAGEIYGDINEEIEFQPIQNPYYVGEVDDGPIKI